MMMLAMIETCSSGDLCSWPKWLAAIVLGLVCAVIYVYLEK
jgi:hypothetical protein